MNKNIIFGLLIGLFSITSTSSYAGHHKATMQYGGDWVDVVAVASDGFMRMSGVFRGTNKMVREDGEVIIPTLHVRVGGTLRMVVTVHVI